MAIATEAVVLAADCVLAWQGSTSRLGSEHRAFALIWVRHYLGPGFGLGLSTPSVGVGTGIGV